MLNEVIKNIFRFVIFVLIQVLLVKNLEIGRFFNPYVYVLFLIMLPFETSKLLLLGIGFVTGLSVDIFYHTLGLHAAASVLFCYCRPLVYKLFSPREGYEVGAEPTALYMGNGWFITAAGILIFIHHLFLFYLEVFGFSEFFSTLLKSILSAITTVIFCLLIQYVVYKKKANE